MKTPMSQFPETIFATHTSYSTEDSMSLNTGVTEVESGIEAGQEGYVATYKRVAVRYMKNGLTEVPAPAPAAPSTL